MPILSLNRSSSHVLGLYFAFLLLAGLGIDSARAQSDKFGTDFSSLGQAAQTANVVVSIEPSDTTIAPGGQLVLAITLNHKPGWHAHTNDPKLPLAWEEIGFVAIPTTIEISGPEGIAVGAIQWPKVHTIDLDLTGSGTPEPYGVFEGRATAFVPVTLPADAAGRVELVAKVGYQACDDTTCDRPQMESHPVEIAIDPAGPTEPMLAAAIFADFDPAILDEPPPVTPSSDTPPSETPAAGGRIAGETVPISFFRLLVVGLSGALGGLILNLTPCVLPVIPIKVMTLVKHGGERRARTLMLGGWMALGVVTFWVVIGLPMAFLNTAFDPSRLLFGNWWVTLSLGLLIALLGVGIMGLFTINLPQSVYAINPKADTPHGSFLFGVMTAVLGLPCFGFVAGGLLIGGATMPPIQIMAVFGGLGVGMASPYLVLAAFPKLVERIPRTGPASELVKQVMGLLMFAAAAFFIAVGTYMLILEMPWLATNMKWWLVELFIGAAGVWLVLRTFQITRRAGPRVVFTLVALAGVLGMGWLAAGSTTQSKVEYLARASVAESDEYVLGTWNHYTPARFEKALADGKVVMIDFTAEWCLNCKAYKRAVLDRDPVKSRLQAGDVVAFEGDTTLATSSASMLMEELEVTGIPLLAIWGPGIEQPLFSTQATGAEVVRRIDQALGVRETASQ